MTSASERRTVAPLLVLLILLLPSLPAVAGGVPRVTVRRVDIVENLRNYHFDKLNSRLNALEQRAESDPQTEMNALNAYDSFCTAQTLAKSRIDDWVKASPDSYPAAVAEATALLEIAWLWRMGGNGDPAENERNTAYYTTRSERESERALRIHPGGIFAYAVRIRAARVAKNRTDFERFKAEALSRQPQSFATREQIMYGMLPRWGGSAQATKDFAASSQQYADRNPALNFLNAWPLIDAGDALRDRGDYAAAADQYTQAIAAGGEYWRAYHRRAFAYWSMNQPKDAARDALHANRLFPDDMEVVSLLAYSTAALHNPEAAILWASEYLRFEDGNVGMYRIVDAEGKELKAQGKANW